MTILIAHRLSTAMHADRIYALERRTLQFLLGTANFKPSTS
jgi:ABC-type multidrug transport system fused ATPase/permease subunit